MSYFMSKLIISVPVCSNQSGFQNTDKGTSKVVKELGQGGLPLSLVPTS